MYYVCCVCNRSLRIITNPLPCCRYENAGRLNSDKAQVVIIAYSNEEDSRFKFDGEDLFEMANPVRGFRSVDAGVRFGRSDLYGRWLIDGQVVNRCQKPIDLLR